jgi:hypothetical protein
MSLKIEADLKFLFTSLSDDYSWTRKKDRWTPDQRELKKILDYPEIYKGIIDSFKTIFNELIMFCRKTK